MDNRKGGANLVFKWLRSRGQTEKLEIEALSRLIAILFARGDLESLLAAHTTLGVYNDRPHILAMVHLNAMDKLRQWNYRGAVFALSDMMRTGDFKFVASVAAADVDRMEFRKLDLQKLVPSQIWAIVQSTMAEIRSAKTGPSPEPAGDDDAEMLTSDELDLANEAANELLETAQYDVENLIAVANSISAALDLLDEDSLYICNHLLSGILRELRENEWFDLDDSSAFSISGPEFHQIQKHLRRRGYSVAGDYDLNKLSYATALLTVLLAGSSNAEQIRLPMERIWRKLNDGYVPAAIRRRGETLRGK